eukprot:gene2012-3910_t
MKKSFFLVFFNSLIIYTITVPIKLSNKIPKILVLGGSGRVGGSAVRALYERYGQKVDLTVIGRDIRNWISNSNRLGTTDAALFIEMDMYANKSSLENEIMKNDIIIHTAGPFQQLRENFVLEYALKNGKKYLDVCDDIELSRICRSEKYQKIAKNTGASAVISTGIWPGASSLLAQLIITKIGGKENVKDVVFSFFTAGSGGAGQTILTATFLILGENVLTYKNFKPIYKKSATDLQKIDFGNKIGYRDVVRLNLIECESCGVSGVPNVETFFGTAPPFWNTLFVLMANIIPQNILQNRDIMTKFAKISLPLVRIVDTFVGSKNGIRVDITDTSNNTHTALLTHNDLEKCVGDAIAAFTHQMILNRVPEGVFFPEEVPGAVFREEILEDLKTPRKEPATARNALQTTKTQYKDEKESFILITSTMLTNTTIIPTATLFKKVFKNSSHTFQDCHIKPNPNPQPENVAHIRQPLQTDHQHSLK